MKKELLSIGEVATMKNLSIKGLRYYEKIGILKPAYVNPDTGYRYYSMSQMIDLDVIATCLELDIPLKSLTNHLSEDGALNLESLLLEGQAIAIEKIHRSQAALARITGGMREIEDHKLIAHVPEPYTRTLPACTLLCLPWAHDTFIGKSYVKAMTALYREAEKHGIIPLYAQGMVHNIHPALPGWAVYVEVLIPDYIDLNMTQSYLTLPSTTPKDNCEGATPIYSLLSLSEKPYQGWRVVRENFEDCFQALFDDCADLDYTLIASEIWADELNPQTYLVEVLKELH